MAGQNVTKTQMLDLLGRLASDDGFRANFEKSPASALSLIGLPPDQVKIFLTEHIVPGTLATKTEFETALGRISNQNVEECLCMTIPSLKLDFRAYK
ncbi:MAG: NHLP-related RiPP peptide [Rudaea sp.]